MFKTHSHRAYDEVFFSSFVSFTQFSPTCGHMPLPAQSLWPGRQPCRPRLVDGRREGGPSSVAPRSRNPPTGRHRDSLHLLVTVFARPTPVRSRLRARQQSQSSPEPAGKDSATSRLRPTCDRKMLKWWAIRRTIVRLVAEVVRLAAEVVGYRKGQISRNKVDGHVQKLKPAIPNRKRSHDQSCHCDWYHQYVAH